VLKLGCQQGGNFGAGTADKDAAAGLASQQLLDGSQDERGGLARGVHNLWDTFALLAMGIDVHWRGAEHRCQPGERIEVSH